MNNIYAPYPHPCCNNASNLHPYYTYDNYSTYPFAWWNQFPPHFQNYHQCFLDLKDYGPEPFAINIEDATKQNTNFRTALWTGEFLQLTLMSINVGDDIGLEIHYDHDQFIRIEQGQGIVKMGDCEDKLYFQAQVYEDYAIFIPAGKWHNLINTGCVPLKLYSIYAPPEHPHGTIHETKENAQGYWGY